MNRNTQPIKVEIITIYPQNKPETQVQIDTCTFSDWNTMNRIMSISELQWQKGKTSYIHKITGTAFDTNEVKYRFSLTPKELIEAKKHFPDIQD